jgi:predicted small metal-binding protein
MDCDFVATGETEADVMAKAVEHARADHGLEEIPTDIAQKAQAAIRDAQTAP